MVSMTVVNVQGGLSRRRMLGALGLLGGAPAAVWAATGSAVMPSSVPAAHSDARYAQAWRAMSRVGYGPTAALSAQVLAAHEPRLWALQQVDAAYAQSQKPPLIDTDTADFAMPLPLIFEGAQQERQARVRVKQATAEQTSPSPVRRMGKKDLADAPEPEHFSRRLAMQAAAWRLLAASEPERENPLLARLTEFWFNHLNVFAGKGSARPFVGHYAVHVIRAHALGRFEDLLLASARHPAMLHYLDQVQSAAEGSRGMQGRVRGLNENYARELMELHTLGVQGGYSQTDVRELARVLTGWTVSPQDPSGFRFAARVHDTGAKRVMGVAFGDTSGRGGEQEGDDAIRMLARHPATAQRISRRLAQFFVADQPPEALVQRLSATFSRTQGDMRAVMRELLQAPQMWDADNRLFKTPLDFACSALAVVRSGTSEATDGRTLLQTARFLHDAGQPLHGWQTPDGYATDAATWMAPEALTRRTDFALTLARNAAEPAFLRPYTSAATLEAVDRQPAAMRAGLMLASPDFMYK